MKLPPDLAAMLSAFADERVRYLIVGGHAVGLHARPRTTKDLDVWLDPAAENIALACRALLVFGVPSPLVEELRTASPDEIVWLGRPPARIGLLLSIPAVDFESAWSRRVDVDLDGVRIHVIGREDLIANKRAVGRPRDKRDVRALEQARKK
jgi:hypothetical protein